MTITQLLRIIYLSSVHYSSSVPAFFFVAQPTQEISMRMTKANAKAAHQKRESVITVTTVNRTKNDVEIVFVFML